MNSYFSYEVENSSEYAFKEWNDIEVYTEPDEVRKRKKKHPNQNR